MATLQKNERNVLLDLIKFLASFFIVMAHTMYITMGIDLPSVGTIANPNGMYSYFNGFGIMPKIFGLGGYLNVSAFTFISGYWFMNYYKKVQRSGIIGKGKDTTIAFRYWGKQYSSYMPYLLYTTLLGFIVLSATHPELWLGKPLDALKQLILSIPQALGINEIYDPNIFALWPHDIFSVTGNLTNYGNVLIGYNPAYWYMEMLIIFPVIAFIIFMKSEVVGSGIFCVLTFIAYNLTGTSNEPFINLPFSFGLPMDYYRLMGAMCLGIWGWYAADAIRKNVNTRKGENAVTAVSILALLVIILNLVTDVGGIACSDLSYAVFLTMLFSGKDRFTNFLNKGLSHLPGTKYLSTMSLSLYLNHMVYVMFFAYQFQCTDNAFFKTIGTETYVLGNLIFCLVASIPFFFIEKYLIKRLSRFIEKITKAREPVVIEGAAKDPTVQG